MFYSCISFTKKKYIAPCAWLAHFVECVRYQHTAHICGEYVCDRERHTIVIRRRKFNETNRQRSHENAQLWDQPRLSQHNTASHRSTATKPFIVTTEERCITVCDRLRLIAVGAWISPGTNVCFYHSRAAFKHIAFCFCNFSFRFVFVLLSLCLCQPKPPGQSVCCIWFSFFFGIRQRTKRFLLKSKMGYRYYHYLYDVLVFFFFALVSISRRAQQRK